jgi:hypothetical protein
MGPNPGEPGGCLQKIDVHGTNKPNVGCSFTPSSLSKSTPTLDLLSNSQHSTAVTGSISPPSNIATEHANDRHLSKAPTESFTSLRGPEKSVLEPLESGRRPSFPLQNRRPQTSVPTDKHSSSASSTNAATHIPQTQPKVDDSALWKPARQSRKPRSQSFSMRPLIPRGK